MSCNIESVQIIRQARPLTLTRTEFALMQATTHNRPGWSFLEYQLDAPTQRWPLFTQNGETLTAVKLPWNSEGSGSTFEAFKALLAQFKGEADFLLFWEGSELSGLRLKDGVVTEHEVVTTLKEEPRK